MKLSEAADLLNARVVPPDAPDIDLPRLCCHPQEAEPGDCLGVFEEFFEYNEWFDVERVERAVLDLQPRVIIARRPVAGYRGTLLQVPEPRIAFARLTRAVFGSPDESMPVVGVTGTNGKTTTAHLIAHIVERVSGRSGTMGTLGTYCNGVLWEPGEFTTGLALPAMRTLARFVDAHAAAVAMEVSSHGLALDRVAGIAFRVGVLTNLARDHLDFHHSHEQYVRAKERLFRGLGESAVAVLNADDASAARMMAATRVRIVTYGWGPTADWRVEQATLDRSGAAGTVNVNGEHHAFSTRLVGRFQVANVLAAAAAVVALGYPVPEVLAAVADFTPVSGRMEAMALRSGATAIIDYAHNPDGLRNLLENCRAMKPRRVLLVFGCGGDRDRGKRPLMGEIAEAGADQIWVTSDNPRTEAPEAIIADIERGMSEASRVAVEPDRALAIAAAWAACDADDLLVIAGKGHEAYQIVGTTKHPFSDRAVVEKLEARIP